MENDLEFRLLAGACRTAFDGSVRQDVRDLSAGEVDWPRLVGLARSHRVEALARRGLQCAGIEQAAALQSDAQAIAARNLAMAVCSGELLKGFERAGLPVLFFKGLPLGVLAYHTPWLKAAIDVDLLIDQSRLEASIDVLRANGFRRDKGKPETVRALQAWHRFRKDSEWVKGGSTVRVDLHTRLTDNPALIPRIGISSPTQSVAVTPDCAIPTLAKDELFAHLCVHGASSAWFRLKWVTDLAALLEHEPPEELARLYWRSQELGAGRAAGQALLVADSVYATLSACADLRDSLLADGRTRWLHDLALRQLAGRREFIEPTARRGGTLAIHLSQFVLLPGARFKASELHRQARAALRR